MSGLTQGAFYTMSKMKHSCGDRSYCESIWEVLATNGTHAAIKKVAGQRYSSFGDEPQVVVVEEFDWTPADALVDALTDYSATTRATTHMDKE